MESIAELSPPPVHHAFDMTIPARLTIRSGAHIKVRTRDARDGALLSGRPLGRPYPLPPPPEGTGNPVTGPIEIEGATPGDVLGVDICSIVPDRIGWCGAHGHLGPASSGVVSESVGRTCEVTTEEIRFSRDITLPVNPMIGCIGTSPNGAAVPSALAGQHGGNLDQPTLAVGSRVFLPVLVPGGHLFVGDMHAAQGDGELSSVALEVGGTVELKVDIEDFGPISWPWIRDDKHLMVVTAGPTFEQARAAAVDNMIRSLSKSLELSPSDALALMSMAANLRVGQAFGGSFVTLRLELPLDIPLVPCA